MMISFVVENPQATPKPHVDIDVYASTSVALTCVQRNEFIEEQKGEEMVSKESIMLEGAHDVILEANESAFDHPSMVHEDKQFAKVEKMDNIVLLMVQDKIEPRSKGPNGPCSLTLQIYSFCTFASSILSFLL